MECWVIGTKNEGRNIGPWCKDSTNKNRAIDCQSFAHDVWQSSSRILRFTTTNAAKYHHFRYFRRQPIVGLQSSNFDHPKGFSPRKKKCQCTNNSDNTQQKQFHYLLYDVGRLTSERCSKTTTTIMAERRGKQQRDGTRQFFHHPFFSGSVGAPKKKDPHIFCTHACVFEGG